MSSFPQQQQYPPQQQQYPQQYPPQQQQYPPQQQPPYSSQELNPAEAQYIGQHLAPLEGNPIVKLNLPPNPSGAAVHQDPEARHDYFPSAKRLADDREWNPRNTEMWTDQDTVTIATIAVLFFMCMLPNTREQVQKGILATGITGLMNDNEYTAVGLMVLSAAFGGLFWVVRHFVLVQA
jgi:hypothetical protein